MLCDPVAECAVSGGFCPVILWGAHWELVGMSRGLGSGARVFIGKEVRGQVSGHESEGAVSQDRMALFCHSSPGG